DGAPRGRVQNRRTLQLSAGAHQLACEQPNLGARWSERIDLAAGGRAVVRPRLLPTVRVTVDVAGGDAVLVGERRVADGATIEVRAGRVLVRVLRGGTEVARAWSTVPRVESCTLRDRPQIGCVVS